MPLAISACKIMFRAAAAATRSSPDKSTRRQAELQLCNIPMHSANLITHDGAFVLPTSCRWLDAVGMSQSLQAAVLVHPAPRQWEEKYHDFEDPSFYLSHWNLAEDVLAILPSPTISYSEPEAGQSISTKGGISAASSTADREIVRGLPVQMTRATADDAIFRVVCIQGHSAHAQLATSATLAGWGRPSAASFSYGCLHFFTPCTGDSPSRRITPMS